MKKSSYVWIFLLALTAFAVQEGCTLGEARFVAADEVTGIVTDVDTGKPVADAIVAIRFERNNTGHSGPHCFRSMATKTDDQGIFKFAAWKQEDTLANYAVGELTVYKPGYEDREPAVYLKQSRRSIGPIPYSSTIRFSKSYMRMAIRPYKAEPTPEDRMFELQRIVANFTCRAWAEWDDMILVYAVRNEIAAAPYADEVYVPQGLSRAPLSPTHLEWIDSIIAAESTYHDMRKP